MDFRVFSRNISENMHARCVREDTKQALTGNLQADGVQSRQTLFVRYCLLYLRAAQCLQTKKTPDSNRNRAKQNQEQKKGDNKTSDKINGELIKTK